MISKRAIRLFAVVAIAAMALPSTALAQATPPAPAKKGPAPPAAPKAAPAAATPTAQATLLGQFGDWGAYSATPEGKKICFALSKPTSMTDNPPNRRNATMAVYLFISSRPNDKVKDEVSILITGYKLKANVDANIAIGGASFALYTQNDGAWVKAAADESKVVDAMRKGADAIVKATTAAGTQTTDTFSLKGITQALDRVAQECP